MPTIREQLASLTVDVEYPDSGVSIHLSQSGGIRISIDRYEYENLTAHELEEAIEAGLTEAMDGYSEAVQSIRLSTFGEHQHPPDGSRAALQMKEYLEAESNIKIEAKSPRKFVTAQWWGRSDFIISIRRDALDKLDAAAMETEFNMLITALTLVRTREVNRIQKSVYFSEKYTQRR